MGENYPKLTAIRYSAPMPPPTTPPPMVVVEWEDATNISTWEDYDDAVNFEARTRASYHCTSVGYLIRDDATCVIVASRATSDFESVGLFERIPRGMVQRVTVLLPTDVMSHRVDGVTKPLDV